MEKTTKQKRPERKEIGRVNPRGNTTRLNKVQKQGSSVPKTIGFVSGSDAKMRGNKLALSSFW